MIFKRGNFNGIIQESVSSSTEMGVEVDRVTHKAYLDVNRFGTIVAAANSK